MDREKTFIDHMIDEIYKMLVLREKRDNGEAVYLEDYIKSLYIEINGASVWSEYLNNNKNYAAVTSIIAYLSKNEIDYVQFRRAVFKMLGLMNKIFKEVGGDSHVGTL